MAMKYEDLAIEICRDEDGEGLAVRLDGNTQALGERLDIDKEMADLGSLLRCFQEAQQHYDESRKKLDARLSSLGKRLYASITTGPSGEIVRQRLRKVRGETNRGLRVRFSWDPADEELNPAGGLPWEIMLSGVERFGLSRDLLVSRFFGNGDPVPPWRDHELKILMVDSQPRGSHALQSDDEMRQLRRAIQHNHKIYVSTEKAVISQVTRRLRTGQFHVLHFMGHGHFSPEQGVAGVLWETEDGGKKWLNARDFAEQLAQIDSLRLVVLSTCWGTALPREAEHNVYHAIAPALIRRGVPAVIGMQFPITHQAAIDFSRSLYTGLADNQPLDAAATEARLTLASKDNREWILPTVFMQVDDGNIIDIDEKGPEKLEIGICNFAKGHGDGMETQVHRFLPLEHYFDGRHLRSEDPSVWNTDILPELEVFLSQLYGDRRQLLFHFSTLWSITFATGYFIEAKSGHEIGIYQRGEEGSRYLTLEAPQEKGPLWSFEECALEENATDIALAISITQPTHDEVVAFLKENEEPCIKRLIHAQVKPKIDQAAVKSGTHALQLVKEILDRLATLSIAEKRATLHVFCAAPNVFSFFLGRLSRRLSDVQLYEYMFGQVGDYRPSFRLRTSDIPR